MSSVPEETVANLRSICEGYGVRVNSRDNKSILSEKLFEAITSNSCIPNISCVDDRRIRSLKTSKVMIGVFGFVFSSEVKFIM